MGKRMMLENGGSLQVDRHGTDAVIQIHDMEEDVVTVARATPPEWDAFVAAGNAALGRPAPASTPLETRLLAAIQEAQAEADTPDVDDLYATQMRSQAEGLRAALAMAREAGPTVPRGAVVAVVPLLADVSTMLADSDDAEAKREAVRRLDRIIVALGRMVTDGPTPTEAR